jgi:hypothetical protein
MKRQVPALPRAGRARSRCVAVASAWLLLASVLAGTSVLPAGAATTATRLVVSIGPPSTISGGPIVTAGTPVAVTVRAVDCSGATVPSNNGTVVLTTGTIAPLPGP